MEVFVARQPILNSNEDVIAYELLYRGSNENVFPNIDGDRATTEVIINSFLNIGMQDLSEGKKCFINFTGALLKSKLPTFFNPSSIVVEILENIEINEELVLICKELKQLGYTIALDDFKVQESAKLLPLLLKYIDIIKVDFMQSSRNEILSIVNKYRSLNIQLLAEKVETRDDFIFAKKIGYTLFQGYFFSKPIIISSHDVPMYLKTYYHILAEISKTDPNIDVISSNIEHDISLSYKLLKLINSPAFRPINKIKSIKQAIVLLGLNELKKWIYVLSLKNIKNVKDSKMDEVIKMSLVRAKLCELLAVKTGNRLSAPYMLTGLFSLIDTLLHRDLNDVLSELPLSEEIQDALLGKDNNLNKVLSWALQIEQANWELEGIELSKEEINRYYVTAIDWATHLMEFDEN
ncbi:EAL and modified HD-GYP domain-containing signal transduction protein [Metabacillus crassostreae]|uniref:EAL and HDOD domain-containing protein n=1 Tax=Metabacillus crassostreae TaxID=929098 RepID=UPI00195B9E48|nr:HDOD domain-containing protein [Metabacillus crassostreae]MBM7605432.1 EAL and modified HD-GYP domain-containing signal transduction protein [Metabacillus crassostreae]